MTTYEVKGETEELVHGGPEDGERNVVESLGESGLGLVRNPNASADPNNQAHKTEVYRSLLTQDR